MAGGGRPAGSSGSAHGRRWWLLLLLLLDVMMNGLERNVGRRYVCTYKVLKYKVSTLYLKLGHSRGLAVGFPMPRYNNCG